MQDRAGQPRLIYTARDAFMDGIPTEYGQGELNWRFPKTKPRKERGSGEKSLAPKVN